MKTQRQPLVQVIPQRHAADCGAAVLSMFLPAVYEEVILALNKPSMLRNGVWLTELMRASQHFDVPLKKKPVWDAEHDDGIAQVRFRRGPYHVVLVRAGLVFDTDCSVWEPDDYLTARRASFGPLLVRA